MNRSQRRAAGIKPKQVQIHLNPEELPEILCDCGCGVFISGKRIRKMSAIHPQNPTGKDSYVHEDIAVCVECHAVLPKRP